MKVTCILSYEVDVGKICLIYITSVDVAMMDEFDA